MLQGLFDLVGDILLLGAALMLTFQLLLPLTYNDRMHYDESITDKTMDSTNMYDDSLMADGTLSQRGVILMTQVQDYSMPEPRVIIAGGNRVNVTSAYRQALPEVGQHIYAGIAGDPKDTLYEIKYDWGNRGSVPEHFEVVRSAK